MPILYVCILSGDSAVITQALGSKTTGNFLEQVLEQKPKFEMYGKKKIQLDAELFL